MSPTSKDNKNCKNPTNWLKISKLKTNNGRINYQEHNHTSHIKNSILMRWAEIRKDLYNLNKDVLCYRIEFMSFKSICDSWFLPKLGRELDLLIKILLRFRNISWKLLKIRRGQYIKNLYLSIQRIRRL